MIQQYEVWEQQLKQSQSEHQYDQLYKQLEQQNEDLKKELQQCNGIKVEYNDDDQYCKLKMSDMLDGLRNGQIIVEKSSYDYELFIKQKQLVETLEINKILTVILYLCDYMFRKECMGTGDKQKQA